jgi:hypothetical protein
MSIESKGPVFLQSKNFKKRPIDWDPLDALDDKFIKSTSPRNAAVTSDKNDSENIGTMDYGGKRRSNKSKNMKTKNAKKYKQKRKQTKKKPKKRSTKKLRKTNKRSTKTQGKKH